MVISSRRWLVRGAVLYLLCASATARAQPAPGQPYDKERARALYAEGLRHYNVAEYDQAIESFKGAYLVSGDARLLFNVAQAYRLKGDCEQALRFYKNFQRENPDGQSTGEAEMAIRKCETASAGDPVGGKAPVPARDPQAGLVGRPAAGLVTPAPAMQTAAAPAVVASSPLQPRVVPGASSGPRPRTDVRAIPAPDHGGHKRTAGVIVAGAGTALVAGGLYFGLKASQRASDTAAFAGEWGPAEQSAEKAGQRDAQVGLVLTGVGVAGLVAGGVLYWLGATERGREPSVSLAPAAGGGAVVWTCRL
jgi:tetratricopeptide (TPR) repeat protein